MKAPVVMLAGGSSAAEARQIEGYSQMLRDAFSEFRGTLISGGTRTGVSALAGDVGEEHGDRITVIGYLPQRVPQEVEADNDIQRYRELRRTSGRNFSVLESLQAWRDVLRAPFTMTSPPEAA